MLSLNGDNRIWLCTRPTDMRRSFDGLSAMVRNVLQQDPLCGDWFVFINKRRTQMRVLYCATGGYAIWCKRLEQGTFAQLTKGCLSLSELMLLIDGIDVKAVRKRQRFSVRTMQRGASNLRGGNQIGTGSGLCCRNNLGGNHSRNLEFDRQELVHPADRRTASSQTMPDSGGKPEAFGSSRLLLPVSRSPQGVHGPVSGLRRRLLRQRYAQS